MLAQDLREPISPDAPGGRDVRYDDEFDALKSEITKQSAVGARTDFDRLVQRGSQLVGGGGGDGGTTPLIEQTGGPDYERIVELATNILTRKSKDLQVAGYLCVGLFRTGRYAGLASGLEAYQSLVESHWESLFPELKRLEGRRQAVYWLAERLSEMISIWPAEPAERDDIARGIATARAIDAVLRERMVEDPPSVSALARALQDSLDTLPRVAVIPAAVPGTPGSIAGPGTTQAVVIAPAGPAEIASADDADLVAARAADFFRGAEPTSPLGYRLLRCLRWDSLAELPTHEGATTPLAAPPENYRTRLQSAHGDSAWNELLTACEEIFYEAPNQFWLDLQRHADQALGGLGSGYAPLRRMLRHEVARLLERLPGVEALKFEDGTPFADAATIDWIDREVRTLSAGSGGARPAAAATGDAELLKEIEEARTTAGDGDFAAAVEMLRAANAAEPRRRARFLRQLAIARLCFESGRAAAAKPLLEELDERVERTSLRDWEPELCLELWTLMRRCYEQLATEASEPAREELERRMERCFDRICRLDVRHVLS